MKFWEERIPTAPSGPRNDGTGKRSAPLVKGGWPEGRGGIPLIEIVPYAAPSSVTACGRATLPYPFCPFGTFPYPFCRCATSPLDKGSRPPDRGNRPFSRGLRPGGHMGPPLQKFRSAVVRRGRCPHRPAAGAPPPGEGWAGAHCAPLHDGGQVAPSSVTAFGGPYR